MNNFLLTGTPGIGKTTLILKLAKALKDFHLGGFFTREIRVGRNRVGFEAETFSGKKSVLAHVRASGNLRVGRYIVNLPEFEKIIIPELENALKNSQVILIDEIGKMELFSSAFRSLILKCLDSPKLCVSTIMLKNHSFADAVKHRDDVVSFEITQKNRDSIDEVIVRKAFEILKQKK